MKAVVDRPDDPVQAPEPLPAAAAPPSRARFAALTVLSGLAAGALLQPLLLPGGGWPARVLMLSLGLTFSSLAAMWVFRRLQLPLEAAQSAAAAAVADAGLPRPLPAGDPEALQRAEQALARAGAEAGQRQAAAEREIERLRGQIEALALAGEPFVLVAADGRIERASPAAAELLAQTPEALADRPFLSLFPLYDELRPEPLQHPLTLPLQRLLDDREAGPLACAALLERRGRTSVSLRLGGLPLRDGAGQPRGALFRLLPRPEGPRPAVEAAAADHRPGLDALLRRIESLQVEARLDGGSHGLLLFALRDGEALAARIGLAAAGQRRWLLARTLEARLAEAGGPLHALPAGCEAALLPGADADRCAALADALAAAVTALPPAVAGDEASRAAVAIGWVLVDGRPQSAEAWLDAAHGALREALAAGDGRPRRALLPAAAPAAAGEAWLRRRLAGHAVRLVAEPILPVDVTIAAGLRPWLALLPRIEDEDGVWLPAEAHAEALAALGLAERFDLAVLDAALVDGGRDRQLLLRLSPAALAREEFAEALAARMRRSGLPAGRLVLAVDAAFVLAQPQRARALRERLLPLGVDLLLDRCREIADLDALRLLPARLLRLDAGVDPSDRAALEALLAAARAEGVAVLACAVRDGDARERLRLAGVAWVQGPAVAPPTPYSA